MNNYYKNILTLYNISCIRNNRQIFSNLNLTLNAGSALILQGPNGSGKSTLLRLIAGYLKPNSGIIFWNDKLLKNNYNDIQTTRIQYISHLDVVKPNLTVFENLIFWGKLYNSEYNIFEALNKLNLLSLKDTPASLLSAGQTKRLALARLILFSSPLWLLDEPTTTLDFKSLTIFERLIEEHRNDGGIVIISTHLNMNLKNATSLKFN